MNVIKLLSSFFAVPASQVDLPLIHQRAYINDPSSLRTQAPLISSQDFSDFVDMFGLAPFEDHFSYNWSLEYPTPEAIAESGKKNPLILSINIAEGAEMVRLALCGRSTELHAMIKISPIGDACHLDHMYIRDGGRSKEIPCGQDDGGDLECLNRLIGCFKMAVASLRSHGCSLEIDIETDLFKRMKPVMDDMDSRAYRAEPVVIIKEIPVLR